MSKPIEIRLGGYGPPTTSFSQALKLIGDRLAAAFGAAVAIDYVWNIMEHGHRAEDILPLVERGKLTLGYQSTSYFTERVPELGAVDLPFLFATRDEARAAFDGRLGTALAASIEARMDYRILGFFENGFRHISNRLRPIHLPADLKGMRIRVLPSDIQARCFALLGAAPLKLDLTEAIAGIIAGTIDAQENPLANTVTYGVHKYHRFHTLTGHFYLTRPIFLHRPSFASWPPELRAEVAAAVRAAVALQRELAIAEEASALAAIIQAEGEIVTPSAAERTAFMAAVQPLLRAAQSVYSPELLALLPELALD
jgi:TRAP-type C4-dicarboxylate transport system substrate-binding protein